ncbi:hypothetical protein ONV75_01750 [Clostridium sp. LQ25]|uniref:hypothetical protein n=1 Tax=Clostridium sp. LQ25 TaxID=2992805 RepID=UPI002257AC7C|nr:hypothetical protein [Clostridium sp. LQ25]UZT06641.1 hypothetical protein ONV75_01750 [Clostridium sp. LQ25]
MQSIFMYVKEDEYLKYKKSLKNGESKILYSDSKIDIEIKKVGRKVYTFINKYGDKKLNDVLNNICSLV